MLLSSYATCEWSDVFIITEKKYAAIMNDAKIPGRDRMSEDEDSKLNDNSPFGADVSVSDPNLFKNESVYEIGVVGAQIHHYNFIF